MIVTFLQLSLKGFHPKMNILSECLCFFVHAMIVNGQQNILHNIFFYGLLKVIQVWNNMRVSKLWQNFHLCLNYPFTMIQCQKVQCSMLCQKDCIRRQSKQLKLFKFAIIINLIDIGNSWVLLTGSLIWKIFGLTQRVK